LFFASFINRYSVYIDLLKHDPGEITSCAKRYEELMTTAVHIPTEQNPGFTDAYFIHPMEIEPLMSGHGLSTLRLAVAEGLIAPVEAAVNALPEEAFEEWVERLLPLRHRPHYVGSRRAHALCRAEERVGASTQAVHSWTS
jgi:S-adenosylmethionine-dependent methyltransferase